MKVMGRKINLNSLIVVILCLALGAGLFYFYQQRANKKMLRPYLPANALWYVEFDFKKILWDNLTTTEKNFFYQQKFLPNLEEKIWPAVDNVATINNAEGQTSWLIYTKNGKWLFNLLPKNFKRVLLSPRLIGLAEEEKALNQIKTNSSSPMNEIQRLINTNFSDNFALNFYFSAAEVDKKLASIKSLPFKLAGENEAVFISLNKKVDFWQYEFTSKKSGAEIKLPRFKKEIKNLTTPENAVVKKMLTNNNGFVIALADLSAAWQSSATLFTNSKAALIKKYPELNDLPTELLTGSVWFLSEKELTKLNNNWLLAIKTNLEPEKLLTAKEKIEKIISNILARTYPKEEIKKLPDGTQVINLIARNQNFLFQKSAAGDYEVIETPEDSWLVAVKDDYFIITKNKNLIENILSTATTSKESFIFSAEECSFAEGQELMSINLKELKINLPGQFLSANIENNNGQIKIRGCLR